MLNQALIVISYRLFEFDGNLNLEVYSPTNNIKGKEKIYIISLPPDLPRPSQRRISDKVEEYSFPPRAGGIEGGG
jgi:hypothetical protein